MKMIVEGFCQGKELGAKIVIVMGSKLNYYCYVKNGSAVKSDIFDVMLFPQ